MTKLSINVNKIATLRNARGGNIPNVINFALKCIEYQADGITVHPRPDERHIKYQDVYELKKNILVELNIEGNPVEKKFIDLVVDVSPNQVTLVPDSIGQLTSNHGWDCKTNLSFLKDKIALFKTHGIRTSIFLDPDISQVEYAKKTGTDRIELYTEEYATRFAKNDLDTIIPYKQTLFEAKKIGLDVNAGHDLDSNNLDYFLSEMKEISEVSIGHAFISDCLYFGVEETMKVYRSCLA